MKDEDEFIDKVYKINICTGSGVKIKDIDELDIETSRILLKEYIFYSDGFKNMLNDILSLSNDMQKKIKTQIVFEVMLDVYQHLLKGFVVKTN